MRLKKIFINVMAACLLHGIVIAQPDSLDIKIGQMVLTGISGTGVDKQVLEEVRKGKVGSLIFFEKNINPKDSYLNLKKVIWTYQQASPIPLFVAIDQEGGRVNRLKERYGFPKSRSAASLGNDHSIDSVTFYAELTAATLAGMGFNVNFAPVVDLSVNPTNPIIAGVERAYSNNGDSVALYARAFIEAHRKLGVATVLKHFPGHGSSTADTHLGIADVSDTWTSEELIPYRRLIASGGADAVMTAHIVNRKLDSRELPATLSDRMVSGWLRDSLNYDGVVFSDDMQMHAISNYFGFEEAIRMAIQAGVDVLLFTNNIQSSEERTADAVHRIIRKYVDEGVISEKRIDESYRRVMALKKMISGIQEAEASGRPADSAALRRAERKIAELGRELESSKEQLRDAEAKIREMENPSGKKAKRNKKK